MVVLTWWVCLWKFVMVARSWSCLRYMHITAARCPVFVQLLKLNIDVLCMAPSHMSAVEAAMSLVTPALCDQLTTMCNMVKKNTLLNSKVLWGICFLESFVLVSFKVSFSYQVQWCVYTGYGTICTTPQHVWNNVLSGLCIDSILSTTYQRKKVKIK